MSLLNENNINFTAVEYLKNPLSQAEILVLSKKLGVPPSGFVRKNEAEFKENNCSAILNDDLALVEAMAKFPKIMERPIAVKGDRAVIGRPPENILTLIS